jgi:hypothetical protein
MAMDVRLAEIAQAPGHQRQDREQAERFTRRTAKGVEQLGVTGFQAGQGCLGTALQGDHHERYRDQRGGHQQALGEVGPGNRQEPAQKRIDDDHGRADRNGPEIGKTEDLFEQLAGRDQAGRGVKEKEHQDQQGRSDAQGPGVVAEAAFEIGRDGQRISGILAGGAQPGCNQVPVGVSAQGQAQNQPAGLETGKVGIAGQAEQQPAAHV